MVSRPKIFFFKNLNMITDYIFIFLRGGGRRNEWVGIWFVGGRGGDGGMSLHLFDNISINIKDDYSWFTSARDKNDVES